MFSAFGGESRFFEILGVAIFGAAIFGEAIFGAAIFGVAIFGVAIFSGHLGYLIPRDLNFFALASGA